MVEFTGEDIQDLEACGSPLDSDILEKHRDYNSDGVISPAEALYLQAQIAAKEAMQEGVSGSTALQMDLFGREIFESDIQCIEEEPQEEIIQVNVVELPANAQDRLTDAIKGLTDNSSFRGSFGLEDSRSELLQFYTHVLTSEAVDNDFLFSLTEAQIQKAHNFLKETMRIGKEYDPDDRRSNYILGIITYQLEGKGYTKGMKIPTTEVRDMQQNPAGEVIAYDLDTIQKFEVNIIGEGKFYDEIEGISQQDVRTAVETCEGSLDRLLGTSKFREIFSYENNDAVKKVLKEKYLPLMVMRSGLDTSTDGGYFALSDTQIARSKKFIKEQLKVDRDYASPSLEDLCLFGILYHEFLLKETQEGHPTFLDNEQYQGLQDLEIERPIDVQKAVKDSITSTHELGEFEDVFIMRFAEEFEKAVGDNPRKYIHDGRIYGSQTFLRDIMEVTIGGLTPEQRDGLKDISEEDGSDDKFFEFKAFTRNSEGVVSANMNLRIYLQPYINPGERTESDDISRALQSSSEIPNTTLREFLYSLSLETLFDGQEDIEILGLSATVQKEKVLGNIEALLAFVMKMESNFKNVDNPVSSAKARYQYLTGEKFGIVNVSRLGPGRYSSFQTGLNRISRLFENIDIDENPYKTFFSDAQDKSQESYLYGPQYFTTEQEIILFLGDMMGLSRTNPEVKKLLTGILLFGSQSDMRILYEKYHHTNPDRVTRNSIARNIPEYGERLSSSVPEERNEEFEVIYRINALLTTNLQENSTGDAVHLLQSMLLLLGIEFGDNAVIFGAETRSFGPSTKQAVIDFQLRNGVIESSSSPGVGRFGPATRGKMKELLTQRIQTIFAGEDSQYSKEDFLSIVRGEYIPREYYGDIYTGVEYTPVSSNGFLPVGFATPKQDIPTVTFQSKHLSNYRARVTPYFRQAIEDGIDITEYETFPQMNDMIDSGQLVILEEQTKLWRLDRHGENIVTKSGIGGKLGLLSAESETKAVVSDIGAEFQKRVRDYYSIPDGWNVRVVVNSLTRSSKYNESLSGSSPNSAHIRGIGFDVSHAEFDIYNERTGEYITLTSLGDISGNLVYRNNTLLKAYKDILMGIFIDFDDDGKVILTKEGSHPHITVIKSKPEEGAGGNIE